MPKKLELPITTQLLYTIFILTIVNLGYFIIYKDSQSLFLFICIFAVVYLLDCNMIYSLLYPLILVNGLNLFKGIININQEGFQLNKDGEVSEKITNKEKISIIKWFQENENEDFMLDYVNYEESIDDEMLSLSTIIGNISNVEIKEEDDDDDTDLEDVDDFIKYVKKITKMKDPNEDELDFVYKIINKMIKEIDFNIEDEIKPVKETKEKSETVKNVMKDTIKQKESELEVLKEEFKSL